jgi:hypothetical protein
VEHNRFSTSVLCHGHLHPITLEPSGLGLDIGGVLGEQAMLSRRRSKLF